MKTTTVVDAARGEQTTSVEPSSIVTAPAKSEGFVPGLDAVLASSKSRRGTGRAQIRPNIAYTLVSAGVAALAGTAIPSQQQLVLRLLDSAMTTERPFATEPEIHALVTAAFARGELKTKQDPFYIFQYYRSVMLKNGALRQITLGADGKPLPAAA